MGRLKFIRKKYNVVNDEEMIHHKNNLPSEKVELFDQSSHDSVDDKIPALIYYQTTNKRGKSKRKYILSERVLDAAVDADPTKHKMYVEWIISTLVRLVGSDEGDIKFKRALSEDLPKTSENLLLYEDNKRKKRFKEACASNYGLKDIEDPTNINQYTDFEQLYVAVFPFKENLNPSDLELQLNHFVQLGQAEMPVKDDKFTVYIPLTLAASEVFSFTNWCTASKGNGMFKSYTEGKSYLRSDKSKSNLIIFIENGLFNGEHEKVYQLHIESDQFMDKQDSRYGNFKEDFLDKSISIRNFMKEYLSDEYKMAKIKHNSTQETKYYKKIVEFGLSEILLDILEDDIISISLKNVTMSGLPHLNRFNQLKTVYLDTVGLTTLHNSLFNLPSLEWVALPFNKLTTLPDTIGNAKNLVFLNLAENPLETLPQSIQNLDLSKGGKLRLISLGKGNEKIANKFREYLPSAKIMVN